MLMLFRVCASYSTNCGTIEIDSDWLAYRLKFDGDRHRYGAGKLAANIAAKLPGHK